MAMKEEVRRPRALIVRTLKTNHQQSEESVHIRRLILYNA